MISLDDEAAVREIDRSNLLDAFATMPRQLKEGYDLGRGVKLPGDRPRSVVLCGMGGSAAAADAAVRALAWPVVPIEVIRDETLPDFVDERDLVICLSYSGETEETLSALDDALGRGARCVTVASGGRLLHGSTSQVRVPDAAPSPRAAVGWLAGAALGVLEGANVEFGPDDESPSRGMTLSRLGPDGPSHDGEPVSLVEEAGRELEAIVARLIPASPRADNLAKRVAEWVGDRVPVVWSAEPRMEAVAFRWKAGFNENAKIPAFASALPELTHHEIVGWTKGWGDHFAVLVLRRAREGSAPESDIDQAEARLNAAIELLADASVDTMEVPYPTADIRIAEILGSMITGDFASAYHALMRGVDPTPIESIARIKSRLRTPKP